jgi:hypothetical protein
MIRDDLRGWNEEIKRLDRPIGQRACGLGGRSLKKKIPQPNRASPFLTVHITAHSADAWRDRSYYRLNQEIPKMKVIAGSKNAGYSDET